MRTKEELRMRIRVLESQIEARQAENRKDEAELSHAYLEMAALLSPQIVPVSPGASVAVQSLPGEPVQLAESRQGAPTAPGGKGRFANLEVEDEPVEIGGEFEKQDAVLALLHASSGKTFDVTEAAGLMYPEDDPTSAYRKIYATLDAMMRNGKVMKIEGVKSQWKPLKQRDPRRIKFPNGTILEGVK